MPIPRTCLAAVLTLLSGHALTAQSVPIPRTGNIEFAGLGGFNAGASLSSESALTPANPTPQRISSPTSDGSIDLQIGVNLGTHFFALADWGYIAGGRSIYNEVYSLVPVQAGQTPVTQSSSVIARASETRASLGLQYFIPLRRYTHLIPYIGASGGMVRSSGDLSFAAVGGPPVPGQSGPYTSYHGFFAGTVGARYYFNERVGIRFEAQGSRVTARGSLGSVGFGLFVRVR